MNNDKNFDEAEKEHDSLKKILAQILYCDDLDKLEMLCEDLRDCFNKLSYIDEESKPSLRSTIEDYIRLMKTSKTFREQNK